MLKKLGITSIYSNKVRNITLASVALGTSAYVLSSDNEFRHKLFADALPVTTRIFDYWHGERKRVLFKGLTNETVLQLAPSCGPNFKYFPPSVAFKAVEPSSQAIDVLADQAEELGFPKGVIDITHANVFEHLQSLGDESENSIVCTHTLSTVDNHKEVCCGWEMVVVVNVDSGDDDDDMRVYI